MKSNTMIQCLLLAAVSAGPSAQAATFTLTKDVATFAGSTSDAIAQQGMTYPSGGLPAARKSWTDSHPWDYAFYGNNESRFTGTVGTTGVVQWVLGADVSTRYLTQVDVWVDNNGKRRYFQFQIACSADGTNFNVVADSGAQDMGATDTTYNLARFVFTNAAETLGVRYVQLRSPLPEEFHKVNIHEVDVFTAGDPVTITMEPTPLDQSTSDLLTGETATVVNWPNTTWKLNDATTPAAPTDITYSSDSANSTATYDLGDDPARFISRVDVWTPPYNVAPARSAANVRLAVSTDNVTYTEIADAGTRFAQSPYDADSTNRLSFLFQRGRYANWRYFRLTSAPASATGGVLYGGHYYEVDVFGDRPKGTTVVIR